MPFENTIKIQGNHPVEIFYKVYGSDLEAEKKIMQDKPVLLWLHGGPGFDHSVHEPFISTLAGEELQVVLIDQRGQGKSGDQNGTEHWNLKQWGDDVFDFCKATGIEMPIVGGISFGGVIAQAYLLQHPTHPAGVILCDTDAHTDKERMLNTFYLRAKESRLTAGDAEEVAEGKARRVKQIAERVFSDPTDMPALQEHFANGIPLCGKNKYDTERPMDCILRMEVAKKYFQNELFVYDFRPLFKEKVVCPVLIMHGDKNAVHSLESAQETIESMPKQYLQIAYFKDSATPVYDNEPEKAKKIITSFCIESFNKKLENQSAEYQKSKLSY